MYDSVEELLLNVMTISVINVTDSKDVIFKKKSLKITMVANILAELIQKGFSFKW